MPYPVKEIEECVRALLELQIAFSGCDGDHPQEPQRVPFDFDLQRFIGADDRWN